MLTLHLRVAAELLRLIDALPPLSIERGNASAPWGTRAVSGASCSVTQEGASPQGVCSGGEISADGSVGNDTYLNPAEYWSRLSNGENPELYATHPFR